MDVTTQEERQGSRFDVAGRYARALFELAEQEVQLERVGQDMDALSKMIASSTDLARVLGDRTLESAALNRALHEVLDRADVNQITRNFVGLVVHNGRSAQLAEIAKTFAALMEEHQAIVHIRVAAARPLSDEQSQRLETICRTHFGDKAQIDVNLDPKLIGGLTLELAGNMFDASMIGKLAKLEENFRQAFLAN